MSQVNTNAIYDASGTSNAVLYGVAAPTNSMGFRNRLINSDMRIDQRNAGASVTPGSGDSKYPVDRFLCYASQNTKYTAQQNAGSVTPPSGFSNYLGITSSSAYSVTSTDLFFLIQNIEGFNTADLGFGAAGAAAVTVSFWVRSSLTGTFGGVLQNSAQNRNYPFSYTISAANTWEQKTVTIAGDTSGTWVGATNGIGMRLLFALGTGSTYSGTAGSWTSSSIYGVTGATSVVGTNGATFYITGVQLEAGSVASPFERRDYGRELIMCQRYYYKIFPQETNSNINLFGFVNSSTEAILNGQFPVIMRTAPTALEQSGTASNYRITAVAGAANCSSVPIFANNTNQYGYGVIFTVASGLTVGQAALGRTGSTTGASGYLAWSAEL